MAPRPQNASTLTKEERERHLKDSLGSKGSIGLYSLTLSSAALLKDQPSRDLALLPPPRERWRRSWDRAGSCPLPGADSRSASRCPAPKGGRASLAPGSAAQREAPSQRPVCRNSGKNSPAVFGEFHWNPFKISPPSLEFS